MRKLIAARHVADTAAAPSSPKPRAPTNAPSPARSQHRDARRRSEAGDARADRRRRRRQAARHASTGSRSRPLFGKRIVVTRAREQASELKRLLEDSGAAGPAVPDHRDRPACCRTTRSTRAIDAHYDWLIFTSPNGVAAFFERLFAKGKDVRALAGTKIAAVGQSTAADLRARGIAPDVVPERFISTELLPLLAEDQHGIRTAVIRAEEPATTSSSTSCAAAEAKSISPSPTAPSPPTPTRGSRTLIATTPSTS